MALPQDPTNSVTYLLFQLNLNQIVNETHNILDLIITNNEDIIDNLNVHPQHFEPIPTDHSVISLTILLPMEHINSPNTTQVIFDYSKANYPGLINFLSHFGFSICEHLPDIDSIWLFIKNSIIRGMHIFVSKFKLKSSQSPKWYTSNIQHQIKCLRTLRKKYKSRPTEYNLLHIKTAEQTFQSSIQQAKANIEAKLVNTFAFSNDSKIFQYVRNLTFYKIL